MGRAIFEPVSPEREQEIREAALACALQICDIEGDFDNVDIDDPITGKPYSELTFQEKQNFFAGTRAQGMHGNGALPCIGGSDAAVVYGKSPFETPSGLFAKKTGLVVEDTDDYDKQFMFACGHLFEAPYMAMFMELTGLETIPFQIQFLHKEYRHLLANVDGLVVDENGEIGIWENKTIAASNFHKAKAWKEGEVPESYWFQIQFYMAMLGLSFCYINCGWGNRRDGIAWVRVEADPEAGEQILMDLNLFAEQCAMGEEPGVLNGPPELVRKDLERRYKGGGTAIHEVNDEAIVSKAKRLSEIMDSQAEKKTLRKEEDEDEERALKETQNELIEYMLASGASEIRIVGSEGFTANITYKTEERMGFDKENFQAEFPDLMDKFYKKMPNKDKTFRAKAWVKSA